MVKSVSWLTSEGIDRSNRNDLTEMVHTSSMVYADVEQPKRFVADIKTNTGKLTDFNKGI
jgi:hypothetical protein